MNASGWVTFKQIVDDVMLSWGDASDYGQFMRYLNFAIKGYEELRLRHLPATKPVLLNISTEMRAVVLPDDYLKIVSVGVTLNGKFCPFQINSSMIPIISMDCGEDSREVPDGLTAGGDTITRWPAFYSPDLENRRILIDAPTSLTQVILNYTPTGVALDGMTYIPRMARSVVEAYMEYQIVLRNRSNTMYDRVLFEKEYLKALMLFRGLQYNTDELFEEYYTHLATGLKY